MDSSDDEDTTPAVSAAPAQSVSKRQKATTLEDVGASTKQISEEQGTACLSLKEDEDEIPASGGEIGVEDAACIVCGKTDNAPEMLLCDGCDVAGAHHMACLDPPLTCAPEGDWFCPDCIKDQKDQEGKSLCRPTMSTVTHWPECFSEFAMPAASFGL